MKFAFPPSTKNTNVPTYTPKIIFGAAALLNSYFAMFNSGYPQHENNRGEPTHHPWLQM